MPHSVGPRSLVRPLLAALLVAVAACDDGPTAPSVFSHPAAGTQWVAVRLPEQTPDARTWAPYVRMDAGAPDAPRRVREMRAEAERQRRSGELTEARRTEEEASLAAAAAMTEMPPPRVLLAVLGALDQWVERARSAGAGAEFAPLRAAAEEVSAHRAAATAALQRGDTIAAAVDLARAGNVARSYAPEAIASRALEQVEARLHAAPPRGDDAFRARRLLNHARAALAEGDNPRALRRALYALQLSERLVDGGSPGLEPPE